MTAGWGREWVERRPFSLSAELNEAALNAVFKIRQREKKRDLILARDLSSLKPMFEFLVLV